MGFLLHCPARVGPSHAPLQEPGWTLFLALRTAGSPAASLPACVPFWNAEGRPHACLGRDDARCGSAPFWGREHATHPGTEGFTMDTRCLCLGTDISILPNQLSPIANLAIGVTSPPARYIYPTLCGNFIQHTTGMRMHWSWWWRLRYAGLGVRSLLLLMGYLTGYWPG